MAEITVDTAAMAGDIQELQNALSKARRQLGEMFEQIAELDTMWDGPANQEFNRQFSNDYENSKELCNTVESIIQCIQYAKEQYNICENEVNGIVASINI